MRSKRDGNAFLEALHGHQSVPFCKGLYSGGKPELVLWTEDSDPRKESEVRLGSNRGISRSDAVFQSAANPGSDLLQKLCPELRAPLPRSCSCRRSLGTLLFAAFCLCPAAVRSSAEAEGSVHWPDRACTTLAVSQQS